MRLALAILFLALGIAIHIYNGFGDAWYLYVASLLLLAAHFLFGNVWSAFRQMKRGNIDQASKLLAKIKYPDLLFKTHRAYYYFIQGMIALQHKALPLGKQHLAKALDLGLRTENDTAMAQLNLAHIHFVEKEYEDAKALLQNIKTLQPSDLLIKQKMEELENALGNE